MENYIKMYIIIQKLDFLTVGFLENFEIVTLKRRKFNLYLQIHFLYFIKNEKQTLKVRVLQNIYIPYIPHNCFYSEMNIIMSYEKPAKMVPSCKIVP